MRLIDNSLIVRTLLIVLCGLLFISLIGLQNQNNILKEQASEYQNQITQLENQNDELENQTNKLEDQIDELEGQLYQIELFCEGSEDYENRD